MFRRSSAFTLLEILIIIAVFGIGILAVLRMSLQNMTTMHTIEQRTAATFLAQEGLELIYHMRDSNTLSHLPWNCVLEDQKDARQEGQCSTYLSSGSYWTVGWDENKYVQISPLSSPFVAQSTLYLLSGDSGIWYTHDIRGTTTLFSRYLLVTGVVADQSILPLSSLLKVESHVVYRQGSRTGEVVLQSFIGNY